jgi:ribonuclease Z
MPSLHFLGTGSAVTDPHRTTTMLALHDPGSVIIVDCGGDVVQRVQACGLDLEEITAVILTHEHPDHVAGFPLMIQKLWLAGRKEPLPIYGILPALTQASKCLDAFDTSEWEGLPEIQWMEVPYEASVKVFENAQWLVTATPALHGVPNIALRFEHRPTAAACAYGSDTAPSGEIASFARGATVLAHEATGDLPGHSTASGAAQVAAAAGVEVLYLVHLPHESELGATHLAAAREIFPQTFKAGELEQIRF